MSLIYRIYNRLRRESRSLILKSQFLLRGGEYTISYGDFTLAYSGDQDMQELLYHTYGKKWYAKDKIFFEKYIKPNDVIIDVGANLGFTTILFSKLVGPNGKVISFEPSPTIHPKLLKTIHMNSLQNVSTIYGGCGTEEGELELCRIDGSSGNASLRVRQENALLEKIKIRPLDDWLASEKNKISFLKIDTEGFEAEVLKGAHRILSQDRPIIYIELTEDFKDSSLESVEILKSYGYELPDFKGIDSCGNGTNFFAFPLHKV